MEVFQQSDIRSLGHFELPTTEPGRGGMKGLAIKVVHGVRTFYCLTENQNAGNVVEIGYPGIRSSGPFPMAPMVRDHGNGAWAMADTLAPHVGVSIDRRGLFFDHATGLLLSFFFVNYGGLAAGPNEQSIVAGQMQPDGTFTPFGCFGIEDAHTGPNGSGAAELPEWFSKLFAVDRCTMTGGGAIASPSMSAGPALHAFNPDDMIGYEPNDGRASFHPLPGTLLSVWPRNFKNTINTEQAATTGPWTHPLPARHLITNYPDHTWGWEAHDVGAGLTGFWNQTTGAGQPQICLPVWTDTKQGLIAIPQVHWGQYRGTILAAGPDWVDVDTLDWSNEHGSGSLAVTDQITIQYDPVITENAHGTNACQVASIDPATKRITFLVLSNHYAENDQPLVGGHVSSGGYVAAYPIAQRASVILQVYDLFDVGKVKTGDLPNDMLVPTSQRNLHPELTGQDFTPGLIYGGGNVYQPFGLVRDPEWPGFWIGTNQRGSAHQGTITFFSLDPSFVLPEADPPAVVVGGGGGAVNFNDAQFVSQTVDLQMIAGRPQPFTAIFKNTGAATWNPATLPNAWRLGSSNPQNNVVFGISRLELAAVTPPGGTATFTGTLTAPGTPGNYPMEWQMVQEHVEWFGQKTPALTISVIPAPVDPPPAPAVTLTTSQRFRALEIQTFDKLQAIKWARLESELPTGYSINHDTLEVST